MSSIYTTIIIIIIYNNNYNYISLLTFFIRNLCTFYVMFSSGMVVDETNNENELSKTREYQRVVNIRY